MTKRDTGTPVTHVLHGERSLDRESITVGHVDVPMRFYRASDPTIFAGFQIDWINGTDPDSGAQIDLSAGAGLGSKYMTLRVTIEGKPTVYEYVDITEIFQLRAQAIIEELTSGTHLREDDQ